MTLEYKENLWGKIDLLHQRTQKEHNNLNIFSDIITKYQHSLSEFSKLIDNIKNKNAQIAEEKDSTFDLTLKNFKGVLLSHISEFRECAKYMESTIIVPIIQPIDDKYPIEKEMYIQYNKAKSVYNNSIINLEKSKKDFDHAAKVCENNIYNLIQLKAISLNPQNNDPKTDEKIKVSIINAKNFENKYYKCLQEANKARENEINKQIELLNYYEKLHTNFYNKINCVISYFIPMVKKMLASVLLSLDGLEDRFKKINIKQDNKGFLEKNKSDLKPTPPIPFVPYYPEANLSTNTISGSDKKELEMLDINYNVISILNDGLRDIRKDLNMEEEKKKYRLRFLCRKIFKTGPGVGFKPEEKKELISLMKESFYKSYFLITLSKQRTKGRFQRSETLLRDLSEILHYILEESKKTNDFESAKNCIILSQTFYHEKPKANNKKETKKVYLFDYIKNFKWLKNLEFWEGIIENMIQNEISKNDEVKKKDNVHETTDEIKSRLSNIGFSQVLSYSNTMIEFKILKDDINKIADIFIKKYEIEQSMAEIIYENIKSTPYPEEDEEDEKYFLEQEKKYEIQKENEDNINNELEERPRALTINKKNEQIIIDSRSKSLREKTTPYKMGKIFEQNEEKDNKIDYIQNNEEDNKIKNVDELNLKEKDNIIIEDNNKEVNQKIYKDEEIKDNQILEKSEENKDIENEKIIEEKNKIIEIDKDNQNE